jgi:hypothetical protein
VDWKFKRISVSFERTSRGGNRSCCCICMRLCVFFLVKSART